MPTKAASWNDIVKRLSGYLAGEDPDLCEVILAICKLLKGVGKLL